MILYLPELGRIIETKEIRTGCTCVDPHDMDVVWYLSVGADHTITPDNMTEEEAERILRHIHLLLSVKNGRSTRVHVGEMLQQLREKETA